MTCCYYRLTQKGENGWSDEDDDDTVPELPEFRETVDKLIRRHSQSLHLTINMTLTENMKFDEV